MSDFPPESAPTQEGSDEAARRRAFLDELEEERAARRADNSGGRYRSVDVGSTGEPEAQDTQGTTEHDNGAEGTLVYTATDTPQTDRAELAPQGDVESPGDDTHSGQPGMQRRDFTGSANREDWRLTDDERAAGEVGLHAIRAVLEAKDPIKRERKISELRAKILEDIEVASVESRIFDLPLTAYPGSPQLVEQAELMEEWLFEQHALKDRFDDLLDGQALREQYYAGLIEESGELAADAWDRVFGSNKLDLLNIKHLLAEANLIDFAAERDGQSRRDIGYKEAVYAILEGLHPQAERYDRLPYEEKVKIVRVIEDLTVDYLWSLHEATSHTTGTLEARGTMLEPEPLRDTFDSFRPAAHAARLRAQRHGQKYRVQRDGDVYRVIAEESPIVTRKLT